MMTKGEHTYVRDRPYIPSTTSMCEGIMTLHKKIRLITYCRVHKIYVSMLKVKAALDQKSSQVFTFVSAIT